MAALVSLLVTDIVGSTQHWLRDADAMRADLECHDQLTATVVAEHGGRVFKHTGDGAFAIFDDPWGAATAASVLHRELAEASWQGPEPLRVRAAVHAGTVHERDGDCFGPAVGRAARLVDCCPPGAVLISGATAELLADQPASDLTVRLLGAVSLRGYSAPDQAHTLDAAHLARIELGDLSGGDAEVGVRGPPPIFDELVGRGDELVRIAAATDDAALVTLVGVGGMGKTRLALETLPVLERRCGDGAWWCDLAAATSTDAVAPVVLDAIGGRTRPGRSAVESVVDHLGDRRVAVVLDNCEHVVDAARDLVVAIMRACPSARVVATSREALGLSGEVLVPVGALSVDEAVALFERRVRAVRPDFDAGHVGTGDLGTGEAGAEGDGASVVRDLCERLDRIPLALELAAARCRSMSPAEVRDRLDDRFRLLRGGRGTSERHRTLHAAVSWSYSLLDDDERALFDAMSVLADGAPLDGVAAVGDLDEYDALDVVDRLVARSLVVPVPTEAGTRYRMLETLRQFGEDRLGEGPNAEAVRDRHLGWMLAEADRAAASWGTPDAVASFARVVAEVGNLRVAVEHTEATGAHELTDRLLGGCQVWLLARPVPEVLGWADPIGRPGGWDDKRADAAALMTSMRYSIGDLEGFGRAVDAVPDEWRFATAGMAMWATAQDFMLGRLDEAEASLARCPRGDAREDRRARFLGLMVENLRLFTVPSDEVAGAAAAEARALLADVRAAGDDLELSQTTSAATFVLCHLPDATEALDVALEGAELARRLGAGLLVDLSGNALAIAAGRLAGQAGGPRADAVALVRAHLIEARARRIWGMGAAMLAGAVLLMGDDDPETRYVIDLVRARTQHGYDVLPPASDVFDGPTLARVQQRAAATSFEQAISLAIDALDGPTPA